MCDHQGNAVYSISTREGSDVSEQLVVYRMQESHVLCSLDGEFAERVVCDHQGNAVYSISPREGSDVSEQLVVYRMQECHVLCALDRELAERVVCDHQGNAGERLAELAQDELVALQHNLHVHETSRTPEAIKTKSTQIMHTHTHNNADNTTQKRLLPR